jgi:hypothetical protein
MERLFVSAMKTHTITVDVYAQWGEQPPRYRVYVDQDLLTERDFYWPGHQMYIQENIVVNLAPGEHELIVEKVSVHGSIETKNITVDGHASNTRFITVE